MIRKEPVQGRGRARLNALTKSAHALVLEHGREYVTTAMIAEDAGASIGTVYRYFDDIHEVLEIVQPIHRHGVTAVLSLHERHEAGDLAPWCGHDGHHWPCETIRALTEGVVE